MTVCDEPSTSADAMTVGDLIEPTGLTSILDTPVTDVLSDLGLPAFDSPPAVGVPDLSDLGLPAFPALVGIDPTALVKPIVDLLGTFGSGSLSGAGDPTASLGSLADLLQSGASTLQGAISSVGADWAGQAATAAIGTAARTVGQSQQIAAQGTAMAADVQSAATIVGAGLVQLQGVVAKTVGLLTAAAPTLVTPAGQVAALGIAAEGLTEGLAVVAQTRAQLAAPTAHISAVGTPVAVSDAPSGISGDALSTVVQQAGPLFDAGVAFVGSALGVGGEATGGGSTSGQANVADPSAPTAAPPTAAGASCCAPCDRTTTPTTGSPSTAASTMQSTSVRPASLAVPAGATGASGAVPSPSTPGVGQTPIELADRPVTSNASTAGGGAEPTATAVQAAHSASGTGGVPMAPMASTGAARPVDGTGLKLTASPATVDAPTTVADDPVGELAALLAQPYGSDVELRLDAGHTDLVGSI